MIISIDTQEPLSATDKAALQALIGAGAAPWPPAEEPAPDNVTDIKKPAKKAAAKKPIADDVEKGLSYAEEAEREPVDETNPMDVAVARASALVASGKEGAERVKKALKAAGEPEAKRVSELEEDQVPTFLEALGDE